MEHSELPMATPWQDFGAQIVLPGARKPSEVFGLIFWLILYCIPACSLAYMVALLILIGVGAGGAPPSAGGPTLLWVLLFLIPVLAALTSLVSAARYKKGC